MKHYSNHYSSSRNYYNNLQKSNNYSLNLSKNKPDLTELYLEKFLMITYKYLAPIFEDDEVMTNFKSDTTNNHIDKTTDEQIISHTPSWIQKIATFFIGLYEKFFSNPQNIKLKNKIKHFVNFLNTNKKEIEKPRNQFATNKSSP